MIKETIINECLLVLKRDDVKKELKNLLSPLIDLVLMQIYPYLYLSLLFVLISFLLDVNKSSPTIIILSEYCSVNFIQVE